MEKMSVYLPQLNKRANCPVSSSISKLVQNVDEINMDKENENYEYQNSNFSSTFHTQLQKVISRENKKKTIIKGIIKIKSLINYLDSRLIMINDGLQKNENNLNNINKHIIVQRKILSRI